MIIKNGNFYTVDVDSDMRKAAFEFADRIINTDNQYSRLLPENIRQAYDTDIRKKLEIQRTYVGKLGEIIFRELLIFKGKNIDVGQMFEIYEGQANVDEFDFETRDNLSVDVKAGFRENHKRLLVNVEQFNRNPKDYYVGVWFNGRDIDARNKLIGLGTITKGIIYGYATYDDLRAARVGNFGEGDAKNISYHYLRDIDELVSQF